MLQLAFLNGKNISLFCLFYESFVLADNPWLWSFADGHGSENNSGYPARGLNIPLRAEARQAESWRAGAGVLKSQLQ